MPDRANKLKLERYKIFPQEEDLYGLCTSHVMLVLKAMIPVESKIDPLVKINYRDMLNIMVNGANLQHHLT